MPLFRTLTLKIKTRFTPPPSPTTAPPGSSSFELVGRQERQRAETSRSIESFASEDGIRVDAKAIVEALEKVKEENGYSRRSRFREELEEAD